MNQTLCRCEKLADVNKQKQAGVAYDAGWRQKRQLAAVKPQEVMPNQQTV